MNKERIYYTKPSITEKEVSYAADAARNGWDDRCYEYINRFERMFRKFTGATYSIATSSCTATFIVDWLSWALDLGMRRSFPVNIGDVIKTIKERVN